MVFCARIDGKFFCGLCGSTLSGDAKKCSTCQSEFDSVMDCLFCDQCGSITPIEAEMCEICGKKMETAKSPVPKIPTPPPIPGVPVLKIPIPGPKQDLEPEPVSKETPVLFRQKDPEPPAVSTSKPSMDLREMLLKSKRPSIPQPEPAVRPAIVVSGDVSENETDPRVLQAKIRELQDEIDILRMSLDESEGKVTRGLKQSVAPPPPEPKLDQTAIDKLLHINKMLGSLIEKMKKYEGSAIYKILLSLLEDTKEIMKLLKIERK